MTTHDLGRDGEQSEAHAGVRAKRTDEGAAPVEQPPQVLGAGGVRRLQGAVGNTVVSRLLAPRRAAGGEQARATGPPGPHDDRGGAHEAPAADPGRAAPVGVSTPAPVSATVPVPAPATPEKPAHGTAPAAGTATAASAGHAPRSTAARKQPTANPQAAAHPLKALQTAHKEASATTSAEPDPAPQTAAEDVTSEAGHAAPASAAIPAAAFAETDVESLLPPPGPAFRPERRARMAAQVGEELAADRLTAQATVDAFVAARRERTAELAALKPEVSALVSTAGTEAQAKIDAAAGAEVNAVRAAVQDVRADLRAQAQQARAQVEADYTAAVSAIRAATGQGRVTARDASTAATGRAGTLETTQLTHLGTLYTQTEGQFRTVARNAAALAVDAATARAREYRSHKINEADSFLDGHLTDNRCDAQAEAAEKVGKAYHDGLIGEGDKQVDALRGRKPTDEASARHLTEDARGSLRAVLGQANDGLTGAETQSLENARAAKTSVLDTIAETVRTAETALSHHETQQITLIRTQAARHRQAVSQAAVAAAGTLGRAADDAVGDVDSALTTLVAELGAAGVPDPAVLEQALLEHGTRLDARLAQLGEGLQAQATQAREAIGTTAVQAADSLRQTGAAAAEAARQTGSGAGKALATARSEAAKGLGELAKGHREAVGGVCTGHDTAVTGVLDGLTTGFDKLNSNFTSGAAQQVTAVGDALANSVHQDLAGTITTEAQKAYDQVQPRWKSVLKWVIIIAIVLVVAVVLGPMVIGAVTGAAAALGASAGAASLIGMVVGGALVGAATSAATTVVDNAFAGRALTTGLGTAIAVGALGGALGGAAAGMLAGPMQGMTQLARYAAQVGVDMVIDTGINAATGNLSWENFATGLLMSALVNGVTAHPRVQAFQHGVSSRGYGAGFDGASSARSTVTGRGGPGSAGPVAIDAAHVNVGDTASPASPYRGTWDMAGGGHNPNEIRPRAAAEGIGSTTLDVDPVTGVAVDKFTRPQLDNAGNTIPDAAAPGGIKVKSTNKSLFPDSMGRPEIEAAGQTALTRALAGTPQSTHTPPGTNPNGTVRNGKFSAIVTTPEGHPIRVEGYYAPAAGGGWEIKTVYPASDVNAGRTTPVPGSRVSVPGGVFTPPDYDSGDRG